MKKQKKYDVLLVGLDNPQSSDPRYALYPYPSGCAGWRLWASVIQIHDPMFTERAYMRIPKTNLFPVGSAVRCGKRAVEQAGELLRLQLRGQSKHVVLLGTVVRDAVMGRNTGECEHPMASFVRLKQGDNTQYAWIPHPSGRNHFYNSRENQKRIGKFIRELLP